MPKTNPEGLYISSGPDKMVKGVPAAKEYSQAYHWNHLVNLPKKTAKKAPTPPFPTGGQKEEPKQPDIPVVKKPLPPLF